MHFMIQRKIVTALSRSVSDKSDTKTKAVCETTRNTYTEYSYFTAVHHSCNFMASDFYFKANDLY
jgi:hypothetical protein